VRTDNWKASSWSTGVSSAAFEEDSLWEDKTKGGLWDEVIGTLVVVALIAAGAAMMLVG